MRLAEGLVLPVSPPLPDRYNALMCFCRAERRIFKSSRLPPRGRGYFCSIVINERVPIERTPLNRLRSFGVVLLALLLSFGLLTPTAGTAAVKLTSDQKALLLQYNVRHFSGIVVDSAMSYEKAIGDNVVPPESRAIHAAMKPHLRVVPVVYWGLKDGLPDSKVHLGQIVVHELFVWETTDIFLDMFHVKFPIQAVIPQSKFGYDDQASMAANNSSAYRPEDGSEHARIAFDINPMQNPYNVTKVRPDIPVQPAGAVYNPSAPGTIVMNSPVHLVWKSRNWEWGGNWGNPQADPPSDFYKDGWYDWQHFQLNFRRYDAFVAQLPPCMQDWTCEL